MTNIISLMRGYWPDDPWYLGPDCDEFWVGFFCLDVVEAGEYGALEMKT